MERGLASCGFVDVNNVDLLSTKLDNIFISKHKLFVNIPTKGEIISSAN